MKPKFEKASIDCYHQVLQWLDEPHVKEFWDNSPEHKQDILIFMNGRKEPSPYFDGIFDYWIGFIDQEPYSLLMTSEILSDESDLPEVWKAHLSKTGRTFGLDFMIGNKKFLGRGIAGPTLEAFTAYLNHCDPSIQTFFIDPAESNPKAKHVYEKGGFTAVATFWREFNNINLKHFLMVKKMIVLEHYDSIPSEYEGILFKGISENAYQEKGHPPIQPFSIFIKDETKVLGGITGVTFYGSLYIDSLWVDQSIRHQGWGSKLMREAEKMGKERGATFVTLNTMDWEGLGFYQKLGYSIEFVREGYNHNSKMYLLRKSL